MNLYRMVSVLTIYCPKLNGLTQKNPYYLIVSVGQELGMAYLVSLLQVSQEITFSVSAGRVGSIQFIFRLLD